MHKEIVSVNQEKFLPSRALLDLAAMKAYAMGRRSKWKDYVDLYFIIKDHFSIDQIAKPLLSGENFIIGFRGMKSSIIKAKNHNN